MRGFSLLVLFGLNAVAQTAEIGPQAVSATASVRGSVIDSTTGKPLAGVHVKIAGESEAQAYGAMTNAEGLFFIPDIPTGEYSIFPEKRGFIFVPNPQKNHLWFGRMVLRLKPGERVDHLVLPMVARTIIAGRVLDQQGDPVSDVSVWARPAVGDPKGETPLVSSTNGRGEFRLSVPPRKYYVLASPFYNPDTTEEPFGSPSQIGYVPTYYPGAMKIEDASILEALAGIEKTGVEIKLARPGAFRVSGEITGISHCDHTLDLSWQPTDWLRMGRDGTVGGSLDFNAEEEQATGTSSVKFYSPRVDSGTYWFYAVCHSAEDQFQSHIAEITLSDSDVTGITLALAPASKLTGMIVSTRDPVTPPGAKISLQLVGEGPAHFLETLPADISANGSFRIRNVYPDRYHLKIEPLRENAYVRSVALNGEAVHGSLLDFLGGAEDVELRIVVSGHGAAITGQVQKTKDDASVTNAVVILLPEHDDPNVEKEECQTASTENNGMYSFQHLAPGRYRLIAKTRGLLNLRCEEEGAAVRQGLIAAEVLELKPDEKAVKNLHALDEVGDAHL